MKCNYCGSRDIQLSRLEKVGMNAAELLLERVKGQSEYIEILEKRLEGYMNNDFGNE